MKRTLLSLSFLSLCLRLAVASTNASTNAIIAGADSLPACVTECELEGLSLGFCEVSDNHCRCTDEGLNSYISHCLVAKCNITEAIVASQHWAQECDQPHDNHSGAVRAAVLGGGVASLLIVILRIIARACTLRQFWWDDWCHIAAGAIMIPLMVFMNICMVMLTTRPNILLLLTRRIGVNEGLGYHLYDIDFTSLSQATRLGLFYYLSQILWIVVIYVIKMSILFLYLRIFPEIPTFRYCVLGTMAFVTVGILIIVPMAIWQCVPIYAIWMFKREYARCLSVSGLAYASAGVNIATEIAILILPLPLLRRLRASISQKLALYALFGCGVLVIGVAAARVPSLRNVEAVHDPTYLNAGVIYWTCVETAVAHLCAAAPAIRPLYVKLRDMARHKRRTISKSSKSEGVSGNYSSTPANMSMPDCSHGQVTSGIPNGPDHTYDVEEPSLRDGSLSSMKSNCRQLQSH